MSRTKTPIPIPVNSGLDLANPVAALAPGKLVRAQNKAPYVWGPRHGITLIDKTDRARTNMGFNGTSSYATIYHNPTQISLGKRWTWDCLLELGAGGSSHRFIWGPNDSVTGGLDVWLNNTTTDTYTVRASLRDSDSTSSNVHGTTTFTTGDVLAIRVTRNGASVKLYVNSVVEATDSSLDATLDVLDNDKDIWIGRTPAYHSPGTYFIGTMGAISIRNYVDDDFSYSYSELPYPRNYDVLAAWTGELIESNGFVFDASSYANPIKCTTDISAATRITEMIEPVHAIKNSTLLDGRKRNMVWVGGRFFSETV